jgi:hypothetical protein
MKSFRFGTVSAVILVVVAVVGFGIAQAAGTHSDQPVLSFEDRMALEPSNASSPDVEITLASGTHSERPVLSFGSSSGGVQERGPVETGAIPVVVSEEPWMKDYGQD